MYDYFNRHFEIYMTKGEKKKKKYNVTYNDLSCIDDQERIYMPLILIT